MQTCSGSRKALPQTYELRASCAAMPRAPVTRAALRHAASNGAKALTLPGAAHGVLMCLASCYGEQDVAQALMVWPSNAYLSENTGYSERTIRIAILRLRTEGLILTRDSPNHRRFAQRKGDKIEQAYGFDLSPLLLNAERFQKILRDRHIETTMRRSFVRQINAVRTTIRAIHAAVVDGHPAFAAILDDQFAALKPPRSKYVSLVELEALLVRAETAYAEAERAFYLLSKPQDSAANGGKDCRHKEPKTEFSIENCQTVRRDASASQPPSHAAAKGGEWAFREEVGAGVRQTERTLSRTPEVVDDPAIWRCACPCLKNTGLPLSTLQEIAQAGHALSSELQLRPSERVEALGQLGPLMFGLLCAFAAQIVEDSAVMRRPIQRPGGLFVSIKRAVLSGGRDLSLDLFALRRKHGKAASSQPATKMQRVGGG